MDISLDKNAKKAYSCYCGYPYHKVQRIPAILNYKATETHEYTLKPSALTITLKGLLTTYANTSTPTATNLTFATVNLPKDVLQLFWSDRQISRMVLYYGE